MDTRFSYCAIWLLKILKKMDYINLDKAVEFIQRCQNFDGGFGAIPGGESHSGGEEKIRLSDGLGRQS